MNLSVHSPNVKYAVIQVSSEPGSPERLVLAYRHEQSLCNFIAGPSIIARGLGHPEEAAALVAGDSTESIPTRGTERHRWANENRKWDLIFHSWRHQLAARYGGWKHHTHAYSAVQLALASAVLALYSKNVVSSMIRTILGI